VKRFVTGMPSRYETAKGDPRLAAAVVTVDVGSGRTTAIERMLVGEGNVESL
jgi:calcineurin-like phosphoesterase